MQCDLAQDIWPKPQGRVTHVAALGVLEYVEDYQLFFHRVRAYNATVILSYQVVPFSHHKKELGNHNPRRCCTASVYYCVFSCVY